jgi:hypothetical protein
MALSMPRTGAPVTFRDRLAAAIGSPAKQC